MNDGWSGFSDEDLRRLKQSSTDKNPRSSDGNVLKDASRVGPQRPVQSRKSNPKSTAAKRSPEVTNQALPPEQRLSVSSASVANADGLSKGDQQRAVGNEKSKTTAQTEARIQRHESTGTGVAKFSKDNVETALQEENIKEIGSGESELILDEQFILKHEIADLEKFREHQKMIEEQNKKKKEMLTNAIQERQKRAKAEAAKLTIIKKELDRLDQMVNADVSVIRGKIEEISREYLEAQKRYDRAEREFVEAKVDLHKKSQQKEQLTEHLYTVIHQNEQRKAKKLSELMNKLEMEGSEDGVPDGDAQSPPVPICHISPAEPRKGCLQSLGLSLLASSPNSVAPEGTGGEKTEGLTEASIESRNSENVLPATSSAQPQMTSAISTTDDVRDNNGTAVESTVSNAKTDNAATSQTVFSEISGEAVGHSKSEKTEIVASTN